MSITTLLWYGPKVMKQVEDQVSKNMDKAAIFLQGKVVESFGNPPKEPDSQGGFKKNSSKKWKRSFHSAPGEPPFVQTGHLRRSISWQAPATLVRLVGSFMPKREKGESNYAAALEYGTSRMAARPFLRPALARWKATIFKIVATGY